MTQAPLHGHVLLGVFAHPDDESLACGGLLARCAALGAAVTLVCATRGEAGPGSEGGPGGEGGLGGQDGPGSQGGPGSEASDRRSSSDAGAGDEASARRRLGELRTRELDAAARVLGVSDLVVLDHADGMLPWVDAAQLESDIRAAIERLRPEVVITFGADGLYWHPDHIALHERTTAVVAAMGACAPALYYVTMPPGQMRAVAERVASTRGLVPGLGDVDAFGALAADPTLVVEAGEFAVRKLAALRCHRSQMEAGPIAAVADDDAARLLGTEHFSRAAVGAPGVTFLDRIGSSGG